MLIYPRGDLDNSNTLVSGLGTFWTTVFQGTGKLGAFYRGQLDLFEQLYTRYTEILASQGRKTIPPFSRQWWTAVVLRASDLSVVDGLYTYGMQNMVYAGGQNYGEAYTAKVSYPTNVSLMRLLMNRITMPSMVLSSGIDYDIVDGRLRFATDPLSSEYVIRRPVYGPNNTVIDYEAVLWGFSADVDNNNLWRYIGAAYTFTPPASQAANDALNTLIDSQITGLTMQQLITFLSAITGVPCCIEARETVETVLTDNQVQVITDKHVYTYPAGTTPIVAVGDVVAAGDQLVDTVKVQELCSNALKMSDLPATLSLDNKFLGGGYSAGLTFANTEVPLQYIGPDSDGIVEVRFAVDGAADDVSAFWSHVHARGKTLGRTLANALDQRDNPSGEPMQASLPATVNPLRLVLYELMRNSLLLIRIKSSLLPEGNMLTEIQRLRSMLTPTTAYLLLLE